MTKQGLIQDSVTFSTSGIQKQPMNALHEVCALKL